VIPLVRRPAPEIETRADRDGHPLAFRWRRRWHIVAHTEVAWRWTEGWWKDDHYQHAYFRIMTRDGVRCVIYRDQLTNRWHMHQTLD